MLSCLALLAAAGLVWKLVYGIFAKSPLDKLRGPPSASSFTGNLGQLLDRHGWDFHHSIAEEYGPVVKIHGLFGKPWLYIYDPLALQYILRDDQTYDELPWYLQSNCIMLGPGILSVTGDIHRRQRKMLTPVFSARHLKELVPIFYQVTHKLVDAISSRVPGDSQDIDVLGWMGRAALELIGQTGIGHSFDPLTEDVADAYADAVKNFAPEATSSEMMLLRQATPFVGSLGTASIRRWIVERLPFRSLKNMIHISDTLHLRSSEIFQEKKRVLETDKTDATDIMSILLRANREADAQDRLTDDQLLGQMSSILFAAMDTTANAMSRILHLLAQHPNVQEKLRREVVEARACGDLDYDKLHALPYLDGVCRETLRLYAPAPQTFRGAMKDAVLPLSRPIRAADGSTITELVIPQGTNIVIGIMASNRDKALWGEDAQEWKPERWLKPLPESVEQAAVPGVYSHLMTFLGGVRSCIGFAFSQLEMKVVISELLADFSFELSEKPVFWNLSGITYPSSSLESTKSELWLKVRRLKG
ncbi:cytochrome P450 [Lentinus tigrinus ALCF2SS1-6]|uniref:Cytochrome P450 n=1 Tax=Lentinus tigrinus ALCF2SS1-6 TaxID=1328759 RepID=A0A5C2RY78_9APHY|nr:cytochrome P450 [Lentinus tigrinus ALCF2SS1-6]